MQSNVDIVRTWKVSTGSDKCVVVENVEQSTHWQKDIVLTQNYLSFAAIWAVTTVTEAIVSIASVTIATVTAIVSIITVTAIATIVTIVTIATSGRGRFSR